MSDSPPAISQHSLACIPCRRRKKRCDRVSPECGECRRTGSECMRLESRKPRDAASVPWPYVEALEARLSRVEKQLAACMAELSVRKVQPNPSPQTGCMDEASSSGAMVAMPTELRDDARPSVLQNPPSGPVYQFSDRRMPTTSLCPNPVDIQFERTDFESYIRYVHPLWPFLSLTQLRDWFQACTDPARSPQSHQLYFIHLVCAIGAYCSSQSDADCPHVARARYHHDQASKRYLLDAGQWPPATRTRAYLLLFVHGFNSPDLFELHDTTNEAILVLTDQLTNFEIPSTFLPFDIGGSDELTATEDRDNRILLIYCYTALEIIASLWNRSFQDLVGSLDDKIYGQGIWLTFGGGTMQSDWEHMFLIRRIQSTIRRFWAQCRLFPCCEADRRKQTADIKSELDQWRTSISLISSTVNGPLNYHPLAMLKTYDYCICCLYQNETFTPTPEDFAVLLPAATENARCFRRIQEKWPKSYLNWGALLEQFSVGIIMLACYWETTWESRTPAFTATDSLLALQECQHTLESFAKRWESANVYSQVYTKLLGCTPVGVGNTDLPPFPQGLKSEFVALLVCLEKRGVSRSILTLLTRIISRTTPLNELNYAPCSVSEGDKDLL